MLQIESRSSNLNTLYFDTLIIFFFSLNILLHLLNKFTIEECSISFLIQGVLVSITMLLYQYYRLTITSKMMTILNVLTILNLSLINMLLSYMLYTDSIFIAFIFNIGFVLLLQSFIVKFDNVNEYIVYCLGIASMAINLFSNRIESILVASIAIVILYLNNRLSEYCTHTVKVLMLYSILSTFYSLPYITFITSSILLSKSYGYLEPPLDISVNCTPSYGLKSFIYTITSFTLVSILTKLGIIVSFI